MRLRLLLAPVLLLVAGGCGLVKSVGVDLFYERVPLPAENVRRDLAYLDDGDPKHRLNLFMPLADSVRREPWPTVVFVHGGGWDSGDRDFTYGGEDLYNNVGRFLARHGIGAAVISYRLQPGVRYPAQVEDMADAVAYVHREIGAYGGDPDALFLMGHSAGAQLAARVALDPAPLQRAGASQSVVCGVVAVSGAALDIADRPTYTEAGADFAYYARRFSPSGEPVETAPPEPLAWEREASPATYASAGDPPFLIVYADGEGPVFERQVEVLDAALDAAGVPSEVVVMPARSHALGVPNLSRDDRVVGPAALAFVRGRACT
ncbi:alpha/beta hydrolase [Rubrivirga sp. S365]|uniref:Alpha/beta hydrolase n=1 Tax=Rubrivirga litoralis TaxID=3075598 RepID=A0ABU3BLI2_9BACT|nr:MULTISPECIES: alpha/beta hydrolase [unclassified Rubrivirga]MDT0630152.1 alpha/beta hydrolase [Rubrivirga sp. F394]MDT7855663.1 alpha/beta hydrolase [Rubrivirga sp. S365]